MRISRSHRLREIFFDFAAKDFFSPVCVVFPSSAPIELKEHRKMPRFLREKQLIFRVILCIIWFVNQIRNESEVIG